MDVRARCQRVCLVNLARDDQLVDIVENRQFKMPADEMDDV